MDWPNIRMYEHWIDGEPYEIHRYSISFSIDVEFQVVKKFFQVMDREPIPLKYKRRKQPTEYGDAAMIILSRLDQLARIGAPIEIGSRYLSPSPWAVFGTESDSLAKQSFTDFSDVVDHYYKKITCGSTRSEFFHFRIAPNLPFVLADMYHKTPPLVVNVAICLLADIIANCGPDCVELYDLYTNDLRDTPGTVKIDRWEAIRCKVFGRHGRINSTPYDCEIGQIFKPDVSMDTAVKFNLVADSDDLAKGERTHPTSFPRITARDFDCYGPEPDDLDNIEMDEKYMMRVRESAAKYRHLGLAGNMK